MARLGDYITQIRGVSYKPEDVYDSSLEDTVPLLRAGNIQDGRIDFSDIIYVSKNRVSPLQYLKKGDIIICSSSGSKSVVGKAAIAEEDLPYTFGAFCKVIRTQTIDKSYLGHFFQSPRYRNTISKLAAGANINNIRNEHIDDLTIPIYNDEEQAYIASQLGNATHIISVHKRQLAKLDELVKAQFVEMFGDPVFNTLGWKQVMLQDVTSKIGSGATPKGGKESYQTDGITLIRSMNVHDGRFEYKDLAHITDAQAAQLDNVKVEENDVFINITGASVARSCVVPRAVLPARVNQHVAIIRCIRSKIHPMFLNNVFLNDRFKEYLLDIGESGGATRQAITKQQLETLTVILPPLELQEKFADFVTQVEKTKAAVQSTLDKAQLLFDCLMQKYFG